MKASPRYRTIVSTLLIGAGCSMAHGQQVATAGSPLQEVLVTAQRLPGLAADCQPDGRAQSEITYNPDVGMDSAGPGSHRIG